LDNITIVSFVAIYLGGVLTSFTPCIYPLVPVIVGVIGSSKEQSKLKNFMLSICYVLGMALTFAVLGVVAALSGQFFGQIQSNPIAYVLVGGVIIMFALSLFNVVPLPTSFLHKAGSGRVFKGGVVLSSFLMGVVSGIIAAPCATAVLAAVLAYVATTQNVILGFSLLFTFAVGLGTLLIIAGTFAGIFASMPKPGKWTDIAGKFLAFIMLILGCYFIFKAGVLSV
jgi:thiol:disulfide interchange protein